MLGRIKDISFFVLLGAALWLFSKVISSTFIIDFLKKDLITILIALLAINATTFGLILTGLKNINDKSKCNFSATIRELKMSIKEQVYFIVISVLLLSIIESKWYRVAPDYIDYFFEISLISVFVAAVWNLYDTALAVFILVDHENSSNPEH